MKASTRAALISAFVFPGLGHLALRRGARGCLFLVPAALAVLYLLRTVMALADRIAAEIGGGALAFDPVAILERVHASGADNAGANVAGAVCIACWLGSIADAWWLGRRHGV